MSDQTLHPTPNGSSAGYEHSEADVRIIVWSTVILVVVVIITCFLMAGLFGVLQRLTTARPPMPEMINPATIPPSPRLQPHPALEIQELRHHEDEVLGTYGWVDQKAGVARIPIDRAMDILAQKGFSTKSGEANGGK